MGSKNKLKRFRENETFSNVLQPERDILEKDQFPMKGNWRNKFFKNQNPIVLELGCGKGEYSVHLAQNNPQINYVGLDIKGARFWRGAKTALESELKNVAFMRTQIELIASCFAENEVDEIWITFPDPRLRDRDEKRRLTFHTFLNRYKKILKPGGILHLKTDSLPFFEFSEGSLSENGWDVIVKTNDLYTSEWMDDHYGIKTRFEEMFYEKGFNISRSRMALCATPLQNCSASLAGVSAAAWQDDAPTQKNRQSNNLCPWDFRFWPPDDWQRCAFVSRENGTDVKFALCS